MPILCRPRSDDIVSVAVDCAIVPTVGVPCREFPWCGLTAKHDPTVSPDTKRRATGNFKDGYPLSAASDILAGACDDDWKLVRIVDVHDWI